MKFSQSLDFIAIDIETTGLSEQRDEIIEIAAVRFKDGQIGEVFDSFVRPMGKVPKFIEHLTHIKADDLKNAPDLKTVLDRLRQFVGNSVLLGHNVSFDLGFINQALHRTGSLSLPNIAWDTAELSRIYLPYTYDHKLGTLVKHFELSLINAHRADADATATGQVLLALADYIVEHFSMITNARIMELVKQAQLQLPLAHFFEQVIRYQRANVLSGAPPVAPKSSLHSYIEHIVPAASDPSIESVFAEDGIFSQKFIGFEYRSGQMDMASCVDEAFKREEHLVVEAGTGVGKSFAYLVPALEFARRNKAKVVVSTNTKNLQEQLFYKDLPQLKQMLSIPFKAVLVKGRENYICERRWEDLMLQQDRELSPWDAHALLYLMVWKSMTNTGDISENSSFDRKRFNITWRKVCSDRFMCSNRKCHHYRKCHVMNLRKQIEDSSVVVANHSLLLADMQMENSTLGEYSYLIIDEAHNLMGSAAKHLGADLSYAECINLINQVGATHRKQKTGFLGQFYRALSKSVISDQKKTQVTSEAEKLESSLEALRKPLLDMFNLASTMCKDADSFNKLRIKDVSEATVLFERLKEISLLLKDAAKSLQALYNILSSFDSKQVPEYDNLLETLGGLRMRYAELEGVVLLLLSPDLDNHAMWIENNPRPDRNIPSAVINYAPVEVGEHLNRLLYKQVPSIVFTSATLALRGSFRYFMNQSGLNLTTDKQIVQKVVDSPFDYDVQARLLITSFLPEPKDKYFQNQALACLSQVFETTDVGTMALFTSYKDLDSVYEHVADAMYHAQRPFYAQGKGGSRRSMLEEFKQAKNAVLLGTSSFWEGVDVQGESLSLLILYKLPFQVPSEPLVEAYIEKLERDQKDSFMHYMLPNALLRLKQGFGRLIRSKTDRGVVLIMDSRVSRKKYGQYFMDVLPGKKLELKDEHHLIAEITRFFNFS